MNRDRCIEDWSPTRRAEISTALRAVVVALTLAIPARAQATEGVAEAAHGAADRGNWSMMRFDFDNDTLSRLGDAFSAGWSLQAHSTPRDGWGGPLGWLLGKLPGMGDDGDGGRVVQRSFGITQLILTPADLAIETLQLEDAPYAGILGIHGSWASYDNRRLVGLQLYGGCLGPCSQGEEVQKFIHEDLDLADPPKGWDNQLDEQWLGNANLAVRYKLFAAADERYQPRRWANDFSVGGQLAVGNAARYRRRPARVPGGMGTSHGVYPHPRPGTPRRRSGPGLPARRHSHCYVTPVARVSLEFVVRHAAVDELIVVDSGRTVAGAPYPGFGGIAIGEDPSCSSAFISGGPGYAVHLTYYRFLGGAGERKRERHRIGSACRSNGGSDARGSRRPNRKRSRVGAASLLALVSFAAMAGGQEPEAASKSDLAETGKKLSNPLSDVWALFALRPQLRGR